MSYAIGMPNTGCGSSTLLLRPVDLQPGRSARPPGEGGTWMRSRVPTHGIKVSGNLDSLHHGHR